MNPENLTSPRKVGDLSVVGGSAVRRFAVDFGAHGSPRKTPDEYLLTLEEAEAQADEWRARADTVGGTAEIYEEPNAAVSRDL